LNALADELGELLTAPKVAKMTGIDVKRVRWYYRSFGGFVLGNRIYFYSKEVKRAIQGQIKRAMDSASDEREKEILSPLRNEKRGNRVGGERKRTIADGEKRGRGSDPFDLAS
jgi:hypothetical protein